MAPVESVMKAGCHSESVEIMEKLERVTPTEKG